MGIPQLLNINDQNKYTIKQFYYLINILLILLLSLPYIYIYIYIYLFKKKYIRYIFVELNIKFKKFYNMDNNSTKFASIQSFISKANEIKNTITN